MCADKLNIQINREYGDNLYSLFIWLLLKLKTVTVIEQILDISSLYFVLFKQGRLVIYYGAGKG